MNDFQKQIVAQIAYKQVRAVMDQWENQSYLFPINFHWDGCITIDEQLFHEHQLRESSDGD